MITPSLLHPLRLLGALATAAWLVSCASALTAPTLLSPAHNATGYVQNPNFTWTPVTDAASYEIQVSSIYDFSTLVASGTSELPRFVPKTALYPANRFWRVRAIATDGTPSAWSTSFTYQLRTPTNTYTIPATATLADIRATIANATLPAKITFAANATYTLKPADDTILSLSGKHDLIIDGNGATIIIQRPTAGFVTLTNCQHVVVRNFVIDYDPLPHSVGRVISSATDANGVVTLALRPEAGYPAFDAVHMLTNWSWGVILDSRSSLPAAQRGRMKPNTSLVINFRKDTVTRDAVDPTLFYVQLTSASQASQFAVDDRVIIFARDNGRGLCAADAQSVDLTFDNIVNYACPSSHYSCLSGSELKVLNCRSVKKDATRWFAGNADGVHCRANLVGPWVENCHFEGTGDDGIALYNKGVQVKEQVSSSELKVLPDFADFQAGDAFCLFDPRNGVTIGGPYTVTTAGAIDTAANWRVTFSPALTAGTTLTSDYTDRAKNDQLFNLTRRNAGFMIRDNWFDGVRRYGTIVRSPDGVVSGNHYTATSNVAVALMNEAASWYNGLYCEGVRVTGNTITGCGFDASATYTGSIMVSLKKLSGIAGIRAQSDLLIANNVITDWNQRAIMLQNATACVVDHNTINCTAGATFLFANGANYAIFADNTTDCVITNNDMSGDSRLTLSSTPPAPYVVISNSTNTTASSNPPVVP